MVEVTQADRVKALEKIIRDTMWMARRYADKRMTYAPGMYNDAAQIALDLGVISVTNFGHDGVVFAREADALADAIGGQNEDV